MLIKLASISVCNEHAISIIIMLIMGISAVHTIILCGSRSFAGPLPSPENVTLSSQNSSAAQLQWKPSYYALNQESAVIHVDPHITHYTVYIFDASNGSMNDNVNVTETSFTPTNSIPLCPIYQVSAWNAGGEGELSEPVQESTPQGEQGRKS